MPNVLDVARHVRKRLAGEDIGVVSLAEAVRA
jgi:hypothetical protein